MYTCLGQICIAHVDNLTVRYQCLKRDIKKPLLDNRTEAEPIVCESFLLQIIPAVACVYFCCCASSVSVFSCGHSFFCPPVLHAYTFLCIRKVRVGPPFLWCSWRAPAALPVLPDAIQASVEPQHARAHTHGRAPLPVLLLLPGLRRPVQHAQAHAHPHVQATRGLT